MTHMITVNDDNFVPYCIAEVNKDHVGELASTKNRDFVVTFQFSKPRDEIAKEKYEAFRDSLYKQDRDVNNSYENVQLKFS